MLWNSSSVTLETVKRRSFLLVNSQQNNHQDVGFSNCLCWYMFHHCQWKDWFHLLALADCLNIVYNVTAVASVIVFYMLTSVRVVSIVKKLLHSIGRKTLMFCVSGVDINGRYKVTSDLNLLSSWGHMHSICLFHFGGCKKWHEEWNNSLLMTLLIYNYIIECEKL
jgi:hypothetical protein